MCLLNMVAFHLLSSKGGSVTEWFRVLDLKSGGPWFKLSPLLLSGFVLGSPEFTITITITMTIIIIIIIIIPK